MTDRYTLSLPGLLLVPDLVLYKRSSAPQNRPYLYLIGTLISEATGGLPRALGTPLTYPTQVPALEFHTLRTAEYSLFTLAVRCSMHL